MLVLAKKKLALSLFFLIKKSYECRNTFLNTDCTICRNFLFDGVRRQEDRNCFFQT